VSILLFIIGAGIGLVGSLKIGSFETNGMRVRVAGIVLCIPFLLSRLLYMLILSLFGQETNLIGLIAFLELLGIGMASSISYWLLMLDNQPKTAERKIQRPNFTPTPKKTDKPKQPNPTKRPTITLFEQPQSEKPATFARMRDYPNIMNSAEAANYLNITEDALIELIEAGKIAASVINYRYHISRIALDEFNQTQD
jgi:excisionase family DNA binding protein